MTTFEMIQTWLITAQTMLLFGTLVAAVIIGIQQNSINQNLLDLEYLPSVEVVYKDGQIRILNRGNRNIFVGSVALNHKFSSDNQKKTINPDDVRLIAPNGFYYYPMNLKAPPFKSIADAYMQEVGPDGEASFDMDIILKTISNKNYIAKSLFIMKFEKGTPSVRMQTFGIVPS